VKKQQIILTLSGLCLLVVLYFFGNTVPPAKTKPSSSVANEGSPRDKQIDIQEILEASKSRLSPGQLSTVNRLEHSVVRGDVKNQQLQSYQQLATFWKDSVRNAFLPAAYYTAEAAKLENSEKSLTFAAQLFLENLRGQDNAALKRWMASESKELFERALQLNPNNDSSKIGLGGSYIFGSEAGNPEEVMQGIQQILEVARRDSTNMYAQFMLGLGGIESGQFDKAIDRLTKVVRNEPENIEAVLTLAEAYERKGDKASAIRCYENSKKLIGNAGWIKEIDQRIKLLQ
jgi:tetratricopeptide (TPR) repeat protein